MPDIACDIAVVGGGSGGIGAALSAARMGAQVALIEKADRIGGTAAWAGVNNWEPGVGGTGIPFDIYRRLKRIPEAVGVTAFGRHCCWPKTNKPAFPGGEHLIDPGRRYTDSLRRHGSRGLRQDEAFVRKHWHGVVFEPEAYVAAVEAMLADTGRCDLRTGAAFKRVDVHGGRLRSIALDDGSRVVANTWIDGTAAAALARACGCEVLPPGPTPLNAATLVYRASPADTPEVEPLPDGIPEACWWAPSFPLISCAAYPNGDRNCNMLPTMAGEECASLEPGDAYRECERRVRSHWHWVQSEYPEFRHYTVSWIAPRIGIRETVHVRCDYMLSEDDLIDGLPGQDHPDIIAISDHAMDRHGEGGGGCRELDQPYGVPFRCLLPDGVSNVLVASMAAGFTPAAATSCRLSRTMMQLGQAAGTAAALGCLDGARDPRDLPASQLREALAGQHVQLEWPAPEHLAVHLADED
jgi:hypothetical protein